MSLYIPLNPSTVSVNNFTLDAFARLRVSEPNALFDSKLLYDKQPLYWDESVMATGSSVHSPLTASVTMTTGGTGNVGSVIRQTKMRFNYQPGRSQQVILTSVLGAATTGITRRLGLFDGSNGLFFQLADSTFSVVQRSNVTGTPVDTVIPRANWNGDKLDGTGASGVTIDFTKGNIFWIDFEWLGVGTVRFGTFKDDMPVVCHSINNENANTNVYMSTPNLPVRFEISTNGVPAAATMQHICSAVLSEGSISENGVIRSVDRGTTGFATGNNTNIQPLISTRLKSTNLGATIRNISISVLCTAQVNFRWAVILNPTVGGTDQASWVDLANSSVQYDVTRNNTNTLTGGTVLASGYVSNLIANNEVTLTSPLTLGSTIAGVRDEIVLAVQNVNAGVNTFYASLMFKELN